MEKSALLENYDTVDLYCKDYPNPAIMRVAIWVCREEFRKQYPKCEMEVVPYHGFIRVIAHEPALIDSATLNKGYFATYTSLQQGVSQLTQSLKNKYPDCEIRQTSAKDEIRIDVYKKGTV